MLLLFLDYPLGVAEKRKIASYAKDFHTMEVQFSPRVPESLEGQGEDLIGTVKAIGCLQLNVFDYFLQSQSAV